MRHDVNLKGPQKCPLSVYRCGGGDFLYPFAKKKNALLLILPSAKCWQKV